MLAGGQSLGPLLNLRLATPRVLVDVDRLDAHAYVRVHDGQLRIGALTRQRTAEHDPLVARHAPLLAEAMSCVGHVAVRNRGTLGGSLAHADPAAELPSVAVALDAEIVVRGPARTRTIPAGELFVMPLVTSLEPDELITEIVIPVSSPRAGHAWLELARRHGDFALAGVAAVITLQEPGTIAAARVVCAGVAPTPCDVPLELNGERPSDGLLAEVAEQAAIVCDPRPDAHATAAYRRRLVGVLVRRALALALERAKAV